MKLLSTITTICLSVAIATAAGVGAPIQARQEEPCSVTLFRGRDFTGEPITEGGDQCARVEDPPFERLFFSARASPGCACSLFADPFCGNCDTCVDSNGSPDLSQAPLVNSVKCERTGDAGCSNSNCRIKK